MNSEAIRDSFIQFFEKKGHTSVPSASLMPTAPNLLFTNAGMNQFVPYFLNELPAPYKRIANSQKCIRAGGKHNDLEDVGFDTYHHTFFEMLGNWSIGDYFKKEAIEWSWELLTKEWNFPKERLYATVYKPEKGEPSEFDQEAFDYWQSIFESEGLDPKIHIQFGNKKDNFWMMGDTGPCGPCSELHIDLTPKGDSKGALVNLDSPWCIEIWNLVFIQLNATVEGDFKPLPACHVDTGMGFERIAGILATTKNFTDFSNPPSNYNSDLFNVIFKKIESLTSHRYGFTMPESRIFKNNQEEIDCAFRVIADHIRTLSFSIADGIIPGNEGRNYVLRRILRRAILFGRKLDLAPGFFKELCDTVIEKMGPAFPELKEQAKTIKKVISNEEASFNKTLERGLQLFDKMSAKGSITGEESFLLYDTYGFPFDLTALIANERKITIDQSAFEACMEQQKERARSSQKKEVIVATEDTSMNQTVFEGYDLSTDTLEATILDVQKIDDKSVAVILDKTLFYGEMGGQIGDTGTLTTSSNETHTILDTQVKNGVFLHIVETQSTLTGTVSLKIDHPRRQAIQRHHSATHLLNWALRTHLGNHIQQAGSLVEDNRLRFDFRHFEAISSEQLASIEASINQKILENASVSSYEIPFQDKPNDVVAVFGEKYGEQVRVVDIGGYSKELCGGTHVKAVGEIGLLKIKSESGIASGVRRIEAICGQSAYMHISETFANVHALSSVLKCTPEDLVDRISHVLEQNKELEKTIKAYQQTALSNQVAGLIKTKQKTASGSEYIKSVVNVETSEGLKSLANQLLPELNAGLVLLAAELKGKIQICASVSNEAIEQGFHAGNIVQAVCQLLDGKGGGKNNFAMGGAPQNQAFKDILSSFEI
jgi:alanyl-tRNA synthetase